MKVYNKEITEKQAEFLLKIRNEKYIPGQSVRSVPCDFVCEFEKMVNKRGLTYKEELNSENVENAICDILRNKNAKCCFYAAYILQDSEFPIQIFEKIVHNSKDFMAKLAYSNTLPYKKTQEVANQAARSYSGVYNLLFINNQINKFNKNNNVEAILKRGSMIEKVYLARFMSDVDVIEIEKLVLESNNIKANYLFAYYLANTFIDGTSKSANYPINTINYIYQAYAHFSEKTRNKMIKQHIQKVLDSGHPEYCYKLARNGLLEGNPYVDKEEAYKLAEQKILESKSIKYITKYALEVPGADKYKHLDRVKSIGSRDNIEYLEEGIAVSEFFRQVG